jgi:transglutaminase-like putative cysteine protease
MTPAPGSHLEATFFLDHDHASVRDFTQHVIAGASSPRERASLLFAAVRDQIWYDPYSVSEDPEHYRASHVLQAGRAYCVPKAVLLAAVLRAAGIPTRLGFADVRNHLQTDTLRAVMGGTDLFVYHGYCSVYIDGRWLKATPAFNVELCERFGVPPVEFEGRSDALMHAFTSDDLPLGRILSALHQAYGPMVTAAAGPDDAFTPPATTGETTPEGSVDS